MRRRNLVKTLLVGSALALVPAVAFAQSESNCGFLGETSVPAQRLVALARGFNLTGWLDGEGTKRPSTETLTALHQRGLTHIRLPVTPERLMPEFSAFADIVRDQNSRFLNFLDRFKQF